MEKLSKLKLPKSAVALQAKEMKAIRGSGGYGGGCRVEDLCSGPCILLGSGEIGVCEMAFGSGTKDGPIGMACVCQPLVR